MYFLFFYSVICGDLESDMNSKTGNRIEGHLHFDS